MYLNSFAVAIWSSKPYKNETSHIIKMSVVCNLLLYSITSLVLNKCNCGSLCGIHATVFHKCGVGWSISSTFFFLPFFYSIIWYKFSFCTQGFLLQILTWIWGTTAFYLIVSLVNSSPWHTYTCILHSAFDLFYIHRSSQNPVIHYFLTVWRCIRNLSSHSHMSWIPENFCVMCPSWSNQPLRRLPPHPPASKY